ncbi:MAG: gamma-glutamyl-gamma-aminobutyrate hydrolase family protein [Candidatus Tectomicrobia bacterium]|nr:gamma-glutamyl-gamma-aminobutyrate hydrolase family protein [Candidatus Tectomicrobia bacterium]
MMKRPFVGLTCGTLNSDQRTLQFVPVTYIRAIESAGGVPLLLPLVGDKEVIREMLLRLDGLLLTGGVDLNPMIYGEEPDVKLGVIDPERDEMELSITREALEREVPILGICRGIQTLNVAAGGTLIQDIPSQTESRLKHSQNSVSSLITHSVFIEPGTLLHEIFGESQISVNSYHHQAVKDVAPGFQISARSPDGVIEGIERIGDQFALGVQWHPEMLYEKYSLFQKLFLRWIEELRKKA